MKALVVSYSYYENTFDFAHGMSQTMKALVVKKDDKNVAILVKDECVHLYHGDFDLDLCKILGEVEIEDDLVERVEAIVVAQNQLSEVLEKHIGAFS